MRNAHGWPFIAAFVVLIVGVILLLHPTPAPSLLIDEIAVFQRPQTRWDLLPAAVTRQSGIRLLPNTSRYVGRFHGVRLFLVEATGHPSPCLVVFPVRRTDAWSIGCGDELGAGVVNDAAGLEARVDRVGHRPEGWVAGDENVNVRIVP